MTEVMKCYNSKISENIWATMYTFSALRMRDPERFKNVSKVTQLVSDKEGTRILLMAVLTEIGMKVLVAG